MYVAPGRYLSGTLLLKDNITLWIDSGATIAGTADLSQYRTGVDGQVWYDALCLRKAYSMSRSRAAACSMAARSAIPKAKSGCAVHTSYCSWTRATSPFGILHFRMPAITT